MSNLKHNVPAPWTPVKVTETKDKCSVSVWGRTYEMQNNPLFSSIVSNGKELLSAPMRLVGSENGQPIVWQDQMQFIFENTDEFATICATAQSDCFIINTSIKIEYDGLATVDLKLMPRGKTVPQLFGLDQNKIHETVLDNLWLEVPLKNEQSSLYHFYPNTAAPTPTGDSSKSSATQSSGVLPESGFALPFKAVLFVGTDNEGLSWLCESDKNWQPQTNEKCIEIITSGNEKVLRFHLLDSMPEEWVKIGTKQGQYAFPPITYRFCFQASPVKPFPENPYKEKLLHIDCFIKIKGDYWDFLSNPVVEGDTEIGFDRIKRLGVTTLVLHEKWNRIQNYWKLSPYTANQLRKIIKECHDRGIKVIPYFGYEISSMSDIFHERQAEARRVRANNNVGNAWYREPWQRAYAVCYKSSIADDLADGIDALMEEFQFDGIYLDGTAMVWECKNELHGCGYTDSNGCRHATYPVLPVRRLMKKLYKNVHARGGIINCHTSDCVSLAGLSFADSLWLGEYIQYGLVRDGVKDIPFDYMRASHSGRNFGLMTEFIAYANPPTWTFQNAISFSLVHGILPRPNDILKPLEYISKIWKIVDDYDVSDALWCPYWTDNGIDTKDEKIKASYYKKANENGERYLLFLANGYDKPSTCSINLAKLSDGKTFTATALDGAELKTNGNVLTLTLDRYGYGIVEINI